MNQERLTTRDLASPHAADDAPDRSRGDQLAPDVRSEPRADDLRSSGDEGVTPMFARDETLGYRTRWDAIQTGFVDEPRKAVEEADVLVAEVMKRLAELFASERDALERQWDRGDQISTEDLRVALQRYRSFFQRLLSM